MRQSLKWKVGHCPRLDVTPRFSHHMPSRRMFNVIRTCSVWTPDSSTGRGARLPVEPILRRRVSLTICIICRTMSFWKSMHYYSPWAPFKFNFLLLSFCAMLQGRQSSIFR